MAQLVARLVRNEKVRGSIPLRSTKKTRLLSQKSADRSLSGQVQRITTNNTKSQGLRITLGLTLKTTP